MRDRPPGVSRCHGVCPKYIYLSHPTIPNVHLLKIPSAALQDTTPLPKMTKQTIVVIGATGKQGGSVVTSILNDPAATDRFQIRAVTRDTGKDNAKKLAARGVEVVQADLNDVASLRKAISGAYGVFAVRPPSVPSGRQYQG